jgi:hypothetical protein
MKCKAHGAQKTDDSTTEYDKVFERRATQQFAVATT